MKIVHEAEMQLASRTTLLDGWPNPAEILGANDEAIHRVRGILFLSGSGSKGCWNHEGRKMEIHMGEKSPLLASCVEWGASSLIGTITLRGAAIRWQIRFGRISRPIRFVHTIMLVDMGVTGSSCWQNNFLKICPASLILQTFNF